MVTGREPWDAELADRRAGRVPLRVVAAKKPGSWIVRALGPFYDWPVLQAAAQRYVGVLDPEVEWSQHEYDGYPAYVVYGSGDIPKMVAASVGVYRFDWQCGDVYRAPAVRLGGIE